MPTSTWNCQKQQNRSSGFKWGKDCSSRKCQRHSFHHISFQPSRSRRGGGWAISKQWCGSHLRIVYVHGGDELRLLSIPSKCNRGEGVAGSTEPAHGKGWVLQRGSRFDDCCCDGLHAGQDGNPGWVGGSLVPTPGRQSTPGGRKGGQETFRPGVGAGPIHWGLSHGGQASEGRVEGGCQ